MPSRRCPHCKVTSSYNIGGDNKRFSRSPDTHIRLDECRNEECQCAVAVVYTGSAGRDATIVDVYPPLETEPDELLPEQVQTAFRQALQSLNEKIWDGCVVMCRRALEEATIDLEAEGAVLYNRIEYLAEQNRITPHLKDWAHEARLGGKLGAHGAGEKKWNDEVDAEEIVEFCKWFFRYVYILPKQLEQRRARLHPEEGTESQPSEEEGA